MRKVTIRDVAHHAGVSTATVSHVINNTRFVKEETRNLVLKSIKELDYKPDMIGRILKTGQKRIIAFIVPDIANPYFAAIIDSIENVFNEHHYNLIISNTKENQQKEIDNLTLLSSGIVDGIIIASTFTSYSELECHLPTDIPLIFIDRIPEGCPKDTIYTSSYNALQTGIEELIYDGHKEIGFLTDLPFLSTAVERSKAYLDTLQKHNIQNTHVELCDSLKRKIGASIENLLNSGCTALVLANHQITEDVYNYLLLKGIQLGRDISLLGYNDTETYNYYLQHIPTICQPTKELGRQAGLQILKRIENPDVSTNNIVLLSTYKSAAPQDA